MYTSLSVAFFILVASYLALVLLAKRCAPGHIRGRTVLLLRALFPTWRFFDDLAEVPVLLVRFRKAEGEYSPWEPCLPPLRRSAWRVLLNPEGNYQLAAQNLLCQLNDDIDLIAGEDVEALRESVSYALVENLTSFELKRRRLLLPGDLFQFKVVGRVQGGTNEADALLSAEHVL
ncbi:MAG: hypothetical protein KDD69_04035 [Bdellovibrionales bacterium]|nr:hypothetical protein [Bdellovibrionales bacterium]